MSRREFDSRPKYRPDPEILALWPDVSGNAINGHGDTAPGRPRPVFWREDDSTPHTPVMFWFFKRSMRNPEIAKAREYRKRTAAMPDAAIAPRPERRAPADWAAWVKAEATAIGADDVGICAWREDWSFEDRPNPRGRWAIVMAFEQAYEQMRTAPGDVAYMELMNQYSRAGRTAKLLANAIRERGHYAACKTGPMSEDVLMIPAAIEAGLGELGKHGSMIHRRFGANFRLSMVLSDLPLVSDAPDVFGADLFCLGCQICSNACPPDAIHADKQMVRGETKWYVDFDKCIPYFVENETCGICLVVCPWSRPEVRDNLLVKMARRLAATN